MFQTTINADCNCNCRNSPLVAVLHPSPLRPKVIQWITRTGSSSSSPSWCNHSISPKVGLQQICSPIHLLLLLCTSIRRCQVPSLQPPATPIKAGFLFERGALTFCFLSIGKTRWHTCTFSLKIQLLGQKYPKGLPDYLREWESAARTDSQYLFFLKKSEQQTENHCAQR